MRKEQGQHGAGSRPPALRIYVCGYYDHGHGNFSQDGIAHDAPALAGPVNAQHVPPVAPLYKLYDLLKVQYYLQRQLRFLVEQPEGFGRLVEGEGMADEGLQVEYAFGLQPYGRLRQA